VAGEDQPRKSNSKSSHQFASQASADSGFYDTKKDAEGEDEDEYEVEEKIWQQVIDRHGRTEFTLIYNVMNKYVSTHTV